MLKKNFYRVTVGFGKSYNEFKELCGEARKTEEYSCLYFLYTQKKWGQ